MIIGVPKEIKVLEHRVGLVPSSVKEFIARGHEVIVETGAGAGINFTDQMYVDVGAKIVATAKDVFDKAEMIIKVKEPQKIECEMLREGQLLFTYLHLAADAEQTQGLINSGCIAIAYETVTDQYGRLPLLTPMSEVAGRLSVMVGSTYLQKHNGGCGRLLSGVPGVEAANVMVIGGGVAGFNAARMAVGLGAKVTILEMNHDRLRYLDDYFKGEANVIYSSASAIEQYGCESELIIGAVLIPGAAAPKLIKREMLSKMIPSAVMVDIAIDQGGCFETSKATTHKDPVYEVDGIVHYCVANMPGAVPLTSALALNNAVLPYALSLADKGWVRALQDNAHLKEGLNVCKGSIVNKPVAEALNLNYEQNIKDLAA